VPRARVFTNVLPGRRNHARPPKTASGLARSEARAASLGRRPSPSASPISSRPGDAKAIEKEGPIRCPRIRPLIVCLLQISDGYPTATKSGKSIAATTGVATGRSDEVDRHARDSMLQEIVRRVTDLGSLFDSLGVVRSTRIDDPETSRVCRQVDLHGDRRTSAWPIADSGGQA